MHPKENKKFTGFIAYYNNGARVYEKENFFSKKLDKKCATNWAEIDKKRLSALELVWNGKSKIKIKKESDSFHEELSPKDWFFSQNGYLDMGSRKVIVLARNIGYIKDNLIHITSVIENTGDIRKSIRSK